jgi:3-oxoacyl-[acyl-carrier-protein] synthase II
MEGDIQESVALNSVFGDCEATLLNNTKSFIGHAMGAAGLLELAGNLPAFRDGICHATINVDQLDPKCAMPGLVVNAPRDHGNVQRILNNSFGMLGINSVTVVGRI